MPVLETLVLVAAKAAPVVIPAAVGLLRARMTRQARAQAGGSAAQSDRVVGPAYAYLERWSEAERRLLVDVADELDLDPAALATVIALESGGDPSAPEKKTGTPRAGLIQVTQGARLPGLLEAEAVWAVRAWDVSRQLRDVVRPFFMAFKGRTPAWKAFDLYKRNFLPADAKKGDDAVIARKDSAELVTPEGTLTRGAVYAANPGFDLQGRGFYTWGDVRAKVQKKEAEAAGKVILVSGRVVDAGAAPATKQAEPVPAAASKPAGAPTVAPALKVLLRQVNETWPKRTKASDGGLPSAEHLKQNAKSDHNTGLAYDFTHDPENGPDLDVLAEALLGDPRTTYVIWRERIANRDKQGGAWRPYSGANPHTRHLHLSIRESARDDARPWKLPGGAAAAAVATAQARVEPLELDPARAWDAGLIDNVAWVPVQVGPYRIRMATDALSVRGVRLPVSFRQVLALCERSNYLPPTRRMADERWTASTRRVVLDPLGVPGSPALLGKYPTLEAQAREWSSRIGPAAGAVLLEGPWKHWILESGIKEGGAVNYGLRRADGGVWQSPGHQHGWEHVDYSQLFAPVDRRAEKDGAAVDLVEELSKGAPELMAGQLPDWLTTRLGLARA